MIGKEIQSEHLEKKKLEKDLQSICIQLESVSDLLLYHVLLHSVYFAVKSAQKVILKGHEKKLIKNFIKFYKKPKIPTQSYDSSVAKCTAHIFSYYDLSYAETITLSYALETLIPKNLNKKQFNMI